jgi:UDP-glucose 4-epimerase
LLAVTHPAAAGRVFNATDDRCPTLQEIVAAICSALGRTSPRWSLPVNPVRWTAGLLEDTARLVGFRPPIARSTIDKYVEDIAVRGERIRRILGFIPQYDLASGWCETVDDMRRAGEL